VRLDGHTSLRAANDFPLELSAFLDLFGWNSVGLHETSTSLCLPNCAICASRCSDSHTVPTGVSGILPVSLQSVLRLSYNSAPPTSTTTCSDSHTVLRGHKRISNRTIHIYCSSWVQFGLTDQQVTLFSVCDSCWSAQGRPCFAYGCKWLTIDSCTVGKMPRVDVTLLKSSGLLSIC